MSSAELRSYDVGALLERPGRRRHLQGDREFDGPTTVTATATGVSYELTLESRGSQIVAEGAVVGRWRGECRRCLEPLVGETQLELREVFETDPTEGETYPIDDGHIDLAAMLEEAVVLSLPLAPLCDVACEGPAPDTFPTGRAETDADPDDVRDPRWAALDDLTFD